RNAIKEFREATDKKAAVELYPKVIALVDKLAKNNIIHKNKASNLKSKLTVHVNAL
ncbi:MAG: small subunit ribosomal protein S20, partial [Bacteroidia bacterium]